MSSFQQKNTRHAKIKKKRKIVGPICRTKKIETIPVEAQTLDLLDKDFRWALKYAQTDKGNLVQRNKGNDEYNILSDIHYE